jgi:REP element-mobilizing transposase RayT
MRYSADVHHRRSIRLRAHDYRTPGAYFVTIVTFQRECTFEQTEAAAIIRRSWRSTNAGHEPPACDFVVMPNHVHGIVWITGRQVPGSDSDVFRAQRDGPQPFERRQPRFTKTMDMGGEGVAPLRVGSVGEFVRMFKSLSTKRINALRNTPGRPVWQRNYYERVLRNERELELARQYILDNPERWEADPNHPTLVA